MKPFRSNKLRSNLSFMRWLIGHLFWQRLLGHKKKQFPLVESNEIKELIHYYCKLESPFAVEEGSTISAIPFFEKTGYNYDFHRLMEPFPQVRFHYLWGDIKYVPDTPTFLRSRPIREDNQNSILLPLNTRRLFQTYPDPYNFEQKAPMIIWRGAVYTKHREDLLRVGAKLACCDFGATNTENPKLQHWVRPWVTPVEQMRYRFIFVIEGNDIASNIRWVMASNSVCMMRRPRFESWFAEGRLKPGFHYIEVADDFSDIQEKFDYYSKNTGKTQRIIRNAKQYVSQFAELSRQYAIGQRVIFKYATISRQFSHSSI